MAKAKDLKPLIGAESKKPPTKKVTRKVKPTGGQHGGNGPVGEPVTIPPKKEAEQRPDPTPASVTPPTSPPATAAAPTAVANPAPSALSTQKVDPFPFGQATQSVLQGLLSKPVDNSPHVIVEARAGTGKTTTLITALKVLKGLPPGIEPSPQQKAVWDAVMMSQGKVRTIGFVAFNKSIATELQRRVPVGVEAMTMHSLGFKAVRAGFPRAKVDEYRVNDLLALLMGKDGRQLKKDRPVFVKAVVDLVGLCKMNLVDPSVYFGKGGTGADAQFAMRSELEKLADHYGVDLGGGDSGLDCSSEVYEWVPKVLEACKDPTRDGKVDYDDMIWLPIVLNLPVIKFDMLMVDEAQDLNRCQQELAKRAGRRLILCGDPKQAIYGFAGADAESMKRMERELSGHDSYVNLAKNMPDELVPSFMKGVLTPPRCIVLPLPVTRRCGKAIVKEANRYVKEFEAFETNPEGEVKRMRLNGGKSQKEMMELCNCPDWSTLESSVELEEARLKCPSHQSEHEANYTGYVLAGHMVLCRTNAPLVKECFRFIKAGKKANIQGRDVGKGLISTVGKLVGQRNGAFNLISVTELVGKLDDWLSKELGKENAKRNPNESKLDGIQDRYDCLMAFTDGANTSGEVIAKIESVFTDQKDSPGIRLSSIHKAKGLEADKVFFLKPKKGMRRDKMKPWELEQEDNLEYVAITRAIHELVYVREVK